MAQYQVWQRETGGPTTLMDKSRFDISMTFNKYGLVVAHEFSADTWEEAKSKYKEWKEANVQDHKSGDAEV